MEWSIEKIINYQSDKLWGEGYFQFGFHDRNGNRYVIDHDNNRLGLLAGDGESFDWSAGIEPLPGSETHIPLALDAPVYLGDYGDGTFIVSSYGNSKIYRIDPTNHSASVMIDGNKLGLNDLHNCVPDLMGNIWIHGVKANRVWCFNPQGELLHTLGDGQPGFQPDIVAWEQVRFRKIFDLRQGPDGQIYVLDSGNFSVRKIDIDAQTVSTLAGTGEPGYTGDGGAAKDATFGGNPGADFDGPWSLSLDERGNIFVGDTQNGVVRMIIRETSVITTIAGRPNPVKGLRNNPAETDPHKLNFPLICSLDYYNGRLFIPEWDGDMVVLKSNLPDSKINLHRLEQ
ncbi:MAG: hypothetical protein FH749_07220 [Firmicutes bacterium]|nr:hypothetical protein [Bacillota bacterium]